MNGHDRIQNGDEDYLLRHPLQHHAAGFLNFSRPRPQVVEGHEVQGRQRRQLVRQHADAALVELSGNYGSGPAIFYDETAVQERSRNYGIDATVQPNQHLSQVWSSAATGSGPRPAEVYAVNMKLEDDVSV
jgi:hypothetical protein